MSNINSVTITGNLTADPEVRNFDNGGSITTLRVAVNGGYVDRKTQQFVEKVSYLDVEVGNSQSKACNDVLRKGMRVAVLGYLEQQRWSTDDGNRSKVVIKASRVEFPPKNNGGNGNATPAQAESTVELPVESPELAPVVGDDDIPF